MHEIFATPRVYWLPCLGLAWRIIEEQKDCAWSLYVWLVLRNDLKGIAQDYQIEIIVMTVSDESYSLLIGITVFCDEHLTLSYRGVVVAVIH